VTETETVTETQTVTETISASPLPPAVEDKRAAILAAAEAGDYEALRPLIGPQFSYSFGGPFEGGPIAYWQSLEEDPLPILARILELPPTLSTGIYTWPFAYSVPENELTEYERSLLGDLADDYGEGVGYLGWRAGIRPNGDWVYFIAGD
jgi:hypothetical protein